MPGLVTVLESAVPSLMLSATFWNAVSGYAPIGEFVVTALVVVTTAALTSAFLPDEARERARVQRAGTG